MKPHQMKTDLDVDQKPFLEIECDSAEELYEEFTQRGLNADYCSYKKTPQILSL